MKVLIKELEEYMPQFKELDFDKPHIFHAWAVYCDVSMFFYDMKDKNYKKADELAFVFMKERCNIDMTQVDEYRIWMKARD